MAEVTHKQILLEPEIDEEYFVYDLMVYIKNRRETLKYTQQEFADKIEMDQSNYSQVERGFKARVSIWMVARILDALGLRLAVVQK